MINKQQTGPRPFPAIQSPDPKIDAIRLMKRHYHAIRMRLSEPYTDAHEVHRVMGELNFLPPQVRPSEIVWAFASKDLKLRDRSVIGSRNVFFPLLVGDEVEKHYSIMDLIKAEMIGEDRF